MIEDDEKPDNVKNSLMLHFIDGQARGKYHTLNLSTIVNSMKLEKVVKQFKAYFNPRKNITD